MEHNLTTVIDLRQKSETEEKSCLLATRSEFNYYSLPVTGGNAIPKSPEDVPKSYVNMVDGMMQKIIDISENAKTNVLYFCNAGKDRTGVVSAILLLRLNVSRQEIIEDYLESGENLKEVLNDFGRNYPQADLTVMTPQKVYMETFLEVIADHLSTF